MKLITKLFAALLGMTSCTAQNQNVSVIAPNEFKVAFENDTNGFLLDVRKLEEFADGHVKGGILAWNEAGLPTTVYYVDSFTTVNDSIDVRIRQMQ